MARSAALQRFMIDIPRRQSVDAVLAYGDCPSCGREMAQSLCDICSKKRQSAPKAETVVFSVIWRIPEDAFRNKIDK